MEMIGRLLHVANSYPGCIDKRRFYAMKDRILSRFGIEDGFDIQHIEGKQCWSCDGTGGLWEPGGCWRCLDGWYKRPVWVTLQRYKLGRYTFHLPRERSYEKPEPDVTRITGYVEHPDYGYDKPRWATILLGLVFDRELANEGIRDVMRRLRLVRVMSRRCLECRRHLWSTKRWRCRSCQAMINRVGEEVPF